MTQRTEDDRLLHLVCFTAHQFYRLQETLIDVLLKVVQNSLNAYKRHHKDAYYDTRTAQRRAVRAFVDCVDQGAISPLHAIEGIAFSPALSDTDKVQCIQEVLTQGHLQRSAAQEQLTTFKTRLSVRPMTPITTTWWPPSPASSKIASLRSSRHWPSKAMRAAT